MRYINPLLTLTLTFETMELGDNIIPPVGREPQCAANRYYFSHEFTQFVIAQDMRACEQQLPVSRLQWQHAS